MSSPSFLRRTKPCRSDFCAQGVPCADHALKFFLNHVNQSDALTGKIKHRCARFETAALADCFKTSIRSAVSSTIRSSVSPLPTMTGFNIFVEGPLPVGLRISILKIKNTKQWQERGDHQDIAHLVSFERHGTDCHHQTDDSIKSNRCTLVPVIDVGPEGKGIRCQTESMPLRIGGDQLSKKTASTITLSVERNR